MAYLAMRRNIVHPKPYLPFLAILPAKERVFMTSRILATAAVVVICSIKSVAGEEPRADETETLSAEIAAADSRFFDAFNSCDLPAMESIFAEDLEFFHDQTGLKDHGETMEASRALCERELELTRELVDGSMEIFPVPDYGAIQKGRHTFCHPVDGRQDCGTFEFVHVWRREDGGWKLARVLSFGH